MNSFLRVIKILLSLALFSIAVAGMFKAEYSLSVALMIGSFFIGIMGPQIQVNPGYAMSYSGSDKWMAGAFALIRAILGIIFLTSSIGGFMDKDYANASIVLTMGIMLFSPLSNLVFYHGGYLVKDQAEYAKVKRIHTRLVIARNAGMFFLFCCFGLYLKSAFVTGHVFYALGLLFTLAVPLTLWAKRDQLIIRPSVKQLLWGIEPGEPTPETSFTPALPAHIVIPATAVAPAVPDASPIAAVDIEPETEPVVEEKEIEPTTVSYSLLDEFKQLAKMGAHQRGYAFQHFLIRLFNESGLDAHSAFRVTGEEIDGSFELDGNVYLLEAKWQQESCSGSPLRDFNGKVEGKASWARGIIVCYSGFSEEAVKGFVTGKRLSIIGMDGKDLLLILENKISLKEAIKKKVRLAGERNSFFVPIEDIIGSR
ncbi:restriction endonuclease [Pseudobacter ginsenosidimutans]|uniref:restriction endonuclease n=1 Tax=Pseudobacter ginsenosidimutans TaxID=661488 RepID=UPI0013153120|nr:restriction endonuclease [Pseudobacter ginsenosidimutans]